MKILPFEPVNGVARNTASPESFFIPTEQDKAELATGDFVKIGFRNESKVERMLVFITEIDFDAKIITGKLNQEPEFIDYLSDRDVVAVRFDHVLDIIKGPEIHSVLEKRFLHEQTGHNYGQRSSAKSRTVTGWRENSPRRI